MASKMCGKTLVTKQSGEAGLQCNSVYIVEKIQIEKEMYLSIVLDRKAGCPVMIYSPAGGMSIEDVAHKSPEKIFKLPLDFLRNPISTKAIQLVARNLGIEEHSSKVATVLTRMIECFKDKDCDLIEINPLVLTKEGRILAADSKITIDDNARYRQPDLDKAEDQSQYNEKERIARKHHLNYIPIGGNIGCLVNGAGLAMATMDIIKLYGGTPANFLDVGGSADSSELV